VTNRFRTWLKFNAVGSLGIAVQVGALALFKGGIGLHYLAATAIAVETAVLHNFVWHERWTWFERTRSPGGALNRLARFHLANGAVSILGNLALMWLFVARFGIRYFVANLLAIGACSSANFWASDRLVFRLERGNTSPMNRPKVMSGLLSAILLLPVHALYEDDNADRLIRSATESTYMLHLGDARSAARELQRKYPDHPAGFLIEAETYWWEAQEDPGNKKIENDYYHAQEIAEDKAERAVQAARYYKPELLAYLASAYASYARFQVTQKDAYFPALRAGLKAHEYAAQVYALDQNYYDIYVGLAAFNYFTGTLPPMIKPFAWLFGASGDKNLGISQFQTAMEKARYSRTEARIVYYSALLSNKEYDAAFPILEMVISDYPDNFVLYDWAEEWFHEQKRDGTGFFEQLYERQIKRAPLLAQYALLEKASLQLDSGFKPEAVQTIQRIRAIPYSDPLLSRKVEMLAKSSR